MIGNSSPVNNFLSNKKTKVLPQTPFPPEISISITTVDRRDEKTDLGTHFEIYMTQVKDFHTDRNRQKLPLIDVHNLTIEKGLAESQIYMQSLFIRTSINLSIRSMLLKPGPNQG